MISADGDGAALAALIQRSRKPESGPILYPAAADRSPVLEATLRAAGFLVETVVAYRMEPAAALESEVARALRSAAIDGILVYSARSAASFLALIADAGLLASLGPVTIYAISEAVAARLRATSAVVVAASPDEDALLRLVPAPGRR